MRVCPPRWTCCCSGLGAAGAAAAPWEVAGSQHTQSACPSQNSFLQQAQCNMTQIAGSFTGSHEKAERHITSMLGDECMSDIARRVRDMSIFCLMQVQEHYAA